MEKLIKYMMVFLLAALFLLAGKALCMEGTAEALKFYLQPNWNTFVERGIFNVAFDAMGQAFFTLSVGIGSMTIFGSYLDKKHTLGNEAIWIILLDTFVALMAGLIIFPICFSYQVNPGSGPDLIFISLPNIFSQLPGGRYWGTLFFAFLTVAALTTVIAVVENLMAFLIDELHQSRKKAAVVTGILLFGLSMPAALGFGLFSRIQPLGKGSTILDFEDFIVSNNLLPLGCLLLVFFCTRKIGWGWNNFLQEANSGEGIRIPESKWLKLYISWILPVIILFVFIGGYYFKFFA